MRQSLRGRAICDPVIVVLIQLLQALKQSYRGAKHSGDYSPNDGVPSDEQSAERNRHGNRQGGGLQPLEHVLIVKTLFVIPFDLRLEPL